MLLDYSQASSPMKLEKDPISPPPGVQDIIECFDLLSVHNVQFRIGGCRQKETENELLLWFDMPGLSLADTSILIEDKACMILKGEGHLSIEDVDGSLNDDGRVRMYGGMLHFPENQFDFDAGDVDFAMEMKNGVLKLVVPKVKPTQQQQQQLQETTDVLLPKVKKQKLEEETTSALLPKVNQLLEEESTSAVKQLEEESADVFYVNVE